MIHLRKSLPYLLAFFLFCIVLFTLFRFFNSYQKSKLAAAKGLEESYEIIRAENLHLYQDFDRSPGTIIRRVAKYNDELIYDRTYHIDENLFRVGPHPSHEARFHAIFAGCSYVFGEGLDDDSTISAVFQKKNTSYKSYNLGFPGGGLHNVYLYAERFKLDEVVAEKNGLFIYFFWRHHLDRFFGRYNYISWASPSAPFLQVDGNKIIHKGRISDQPIYKKYMLAKENGMDEVLLRSEPPNEWSDEELKKFVLVVKKLKANYLKAFPKGKFIVVIHPFFEPHHPLEKRVEDLIRKQGITVLNLYPPYEDYLRENNLTRAQFEFEHEGHPNERFNVVFSDLLSMDLKQWLAR